MTLAEQLSKKYTNQTKFGRVGDDLDMRRAIGEALERAAQEAEHEMVDAEDTKDITDRAYNQACVHVALAIRRLNAEG